MSFLNYIIHRIVILLFMFIFSGNYLFAGNKDLSSKEVDSLIQKLSLSEPDSNRVNILIGLTRAFMSIDPETALNYGKQAERLSKELGFDNGYTKSLSEQGEACYYLGKYDEAIDYYLKAIQEYESVNNFKGIAGVENNIGAVFFNQNKLEEALAHYNKAIIYSGKANDKRGITTAKVNIGNIYFASDDLDKALIYYKDALILKEELNDRGGIALILNNLGNVYGTKGDFEKSRDYFIRSLKINEELGNLYTVSMTLNNIGLLYQMEGDSTEALNYMRRSLYSAYAIQAKDLIKDAYLAMSEAYAQFNNYKAAFKVYKKYIEVKDSLINEESNRNIQELKEKYNSAKNEKQIALQQSEIIREQEFKTSLYWIISLIAFVLVLVILLSVYLVKLNKERREKNEQLESQKNIIQEKNLELYDKNKNITDSITYASRIQTAILPPDLLLKTAFAESFVFYEPKDIVSGDFYWMDHHSDYTLFAVADCTGHGVPGAFVSIAGSNLLTEAVTIHQLRCPSKILHELNKGLARMLHQDSRIDSVRDGMDIALCVFDRKRGVVEFAGAFNPMWIIRNGELMEFDGNKFPVGDYVENDKVEFKKIELQIEKGDLLYIFSDGYPDQFGGSLGKKLKYSGFKKILLSLVGLPMKEQKEVLIKEFYNWKGELEQLDDICVMGIRF